MQVCERGFGLLSIRPTGAYGGYKQWLRGEITYADALLRAPMSGIYKRNIIGGKVVWCQMPFYRPANPQTVPQQARRSVFSAGVIHWQGLDASAKSAYDKRAKRLHMSGFNLHQREWLRTH